MGEVPATKLDILNLFPGAHNVEGDNRPCKLSSDLHTHMHIIHMLYTPQIHAHILTEYTHVYT